MSRALREETDASFTYTGTWVANSGDNTASGGSWKSTTGGVSATCAIAVASGGAATAFALKCMSRADSAVDVQVTVAESGFGAVTFTWNQWNHQTGVADANYNLPRQMSAPYFFQSPAAAKTITITGGVTAGNGGTAMTSVDALELYTAEAQTAGRLTSFGHSMIYPVTSGADGTRQANGFAARFAATLSAQNYLGSSSWVDDNQGVPSEDLTNGSYFSGSSPAYTQFTNSRYYNQTAIWTPGWMRAEAGDLWPSPAPGAGPGIVPNWTVAANYLGGVAQWWARKFAVGLVMHGFNDRSYYQLYDAGAAISGTSANTGFRDAASHATAPAAGGGYSLEAFKQRLRELLYRPMMNITPIPRIYVLGTPNTANGAAMPPGDLALAMDAAMATVLAEGWVRNAWYVPLFAATTGSGAANVSGSDPHPNALGHQLIHDALRRFHDRVGAQPSAFAGARL